MICYLDETVVFETRTVVCCGPFYVYNYSSNPCNCFFCLHANLSKLFLTQSAEPVNDLDYLNDDYWLKYTLFNYSIQNISHINDTLGKALFIVHLHFSCFFFRLYFLSIA